MVTIPSERAYIEMNRYIETFCLDYDINDVLILYLRLSPKMIISVMNGVSIKLVFRNPNIEKETISLYIEDIKGHPSYWVKSANKKNNSIQNNLLPSIDEIYEYLYSHTFIRIAIFDFSLKHIYSHDVELITPDETIINWRDRVIKLSPVPLLDLASPIENKDTGYILKFKPINRTETTTYTNIKFINDWVDDKPYILSTNKNEEFFDCANYTEIGQLGYFQEQCIKEILTNYFKPHIHLFSSIKLYNKSELTDFVILFQGVTVLIESKLDSAFEKYPDKIKDKEKAVTSLINKATKQLINAKKVLEENADMIDNINFTKMFKKNSIIVKICLISEITLINKISLTESLSQYNKSDIPVIMSIYTFMKMLTICQTNEKIVQKILTIQNKFEDSDDVLILEDLEYIGENDTLLKIMKL